MIKNYLEKHKKEIEKIISKYLDYNRFKIGQKSECLKLIEAIRYSTLSGGKRIRSMLLFMAAEACNETKNNEMIGVAATAIEMMHCYSLIHDDLPAMDNDNLRRGKPSCHVAFGEANAILAGDALHSFSYELLSTAGNCPEEMRLKLIRQLSKAAGIDGMVGGQAIDLAVVGKKIDHNELKYMHQLKTGALISSSVLMGGICANATEQQLESLKRYGEAIGLAFQVKDDILDLETPVETLGKTSGSDTALNKPTYPSILGLKRSKNECENLCNIAIEALDCFGDSANLLRETAKYIVSRSF